jgi:molecular chaperone GrpE
MTEHAARETSGPPARPSGPSEPEPPRQMPERDGIAAENPPAEVAATGEPASSTGRAAPDGADVPPGPGAAELEDRWRRAAADLDNLRKRYARDVTRARAEERELVAASFLPVLDNIDRALEHAGADPQAIAEGVRAVREQALAVLAALGYQRDEAAGVPFDPSRHEVVGVVDAEGTDVTPGSVAAVLRPGYSGGPGRQLRPAAVTVAQPSEG